MINRIFVTAPSHRVSELSEAPRNLWKHLGV
jgi:hypothetical protein